MSEDTTRDYVKYPTFDGKDKNWPFYKKKMESHLARMDLSELLGDSAKQIPKDDAVDTDAKVQKEIDELRKKNRKAAGILLNSIVCGDEKGKAAFFLIERYHNAADGYAGGYFKKEWEALIARYEQIQVKNLRDQKEEYHNEKMDRNEQPSLFIVKLDRMRKDLAKLGYDVDDETFVQDILGKLPESNDPEKMTPHEVERKLIDGKIEDSSKKYEINDLITDLEKVYQAKQKNKSNGKSNDSAFYNADGYHKKNNNNGRSHKKFTKQFNVL